MRANDGAWIGWPGDTDERPRAVRGRRPDAGAGRALASRRSRSSTRASPTRTLWPLYHDVVAKPEFHREWWDAYVTVNQRFADAAAEVAAEGATVWVQDYQLQLVPAMLRELRPDLRIGFFLHIPFPPAELFSQLPWRRQILEGLLGADLVGFQLSGRAPRTSSGWSASASGHKTHRDTVYLPDGRVVQAEGVPDLDRRRGLRGAGPLRAGARRGPARSARELGNPTKVFLGIDRLDYTKGIYARLRAFSELIADGDFTVEDAVFVQVATPSRERVDQYRRLRDDIDRLVGRINGDLGRIGRPAISYLHSSFPREEMAALYRAADIMVVTPFRDGMNLVAKEYVACRLRRRRRAGALGVRRRGRRAAAGLPGQPLRHQRHEGADARGLHAPSRRTCHAGCGRCARRSGRTTSPTGPRRSSTTSAAPGTRTTSRSDRPVAAEPASNTCRTADARDLHDQLVICRARI